MSDEIGLREFNVLVECEVQGWIKILAKDADDVQRRILDRGVVIPNQRERRWGKVVQPIEPITKYGRVKVRRDGGMTCGSNPERLLYLDCGHTTCIPLDTWFPENPWVECSSCQIAAEKLKD